MKRAFLNTVLAILAFALLPVAALAEVTGTATANPRLVRLGVPFEVILEITADEQAQVRQPAFPTPTGLNLNTHRINQGMSIVSSGARTETTYTFVAEYTADQPGAYSIGPFRMSYTDASGDEQELVIDPVTVEVHEDAPRPASPIVKGSLPWWWTYAIAAVLLAVLAGLVAAWFYMKRRPRIAPPPAPLPISPRTPEQAAYDEIRKLVLPSADDEGAVKGYYDSVDEVLRKYITKRYEVPTADRTAWEIRQEFNRQKRLDTRIRGVLQLMNDCDWVKYAKTRPGNNDIARVVERAADTLLGTKPGDAGEIDSVKG